MRRLVLFFVKYPEPGRVKTRLAATMGPGPASDIYRRLAQAAALAIPHDVAVRVLFEPPERAEEVKRWLAPLLPGAGFEPQSGGDLGERLDRAFKNALAGGWEAVAAIGSDCIELSSAIWEETWSALAAHDAVIGPAHDGGYYLLALTQPRAALFHGIAWSTGAVFAETAARAAATGLRLHVLPKLHDVDTEDDWLRAQPRLQP